MTEERDNVTVFPTDPGSVEVTIDRRTIYRRSCPHDRSALRESHSAGYRERFVYCRKCKERLDPMEILWRYARNDDRVRGEIEAWEQLEEAWRWLWDNRGSLSISQAGGVRGSISINGKRRSRKPHSAEARGLPSQIVGVVKALKLMKKWER